MSSVFRGCRSHACARVCRARRCLLRSPGRFSHVCIRRQTIRDRRSLWFEAKTFIVYGSESCILIRVYVSSVVPY